MITKTTDKHSLLWQQNFLSKGLLLTIGLGLGVLLAYLITIESWALIATLLLIGPATVIFTKYPLIGFFIWFAVAPMFAVPKDLSQLMVFWVLHRLIIPVALLTILMPYIFRIKKEWPIKLGLAELVMCAALGFIILSAAILTEKKFINTSYRIYDRFFIYYCLYLLIRFAQIKENDFRILVWFCVFQLIFQTVLGLMANFAPQTLPLIWYNKNSEARTVGSFNAPGRFSAMLAFCGLIIYHAAIQWRKNIKWQTYWVLLITFGLFWLMILMTYAKASWLAGILILPGLIFIYPTQTLRMTGIIAALFVFIGVPLLASQLDYAQERLEHDSTNGRMIANISMTNMIKYSPIYGIGYNNLTSNLDKFATKVEGFASKHVDSHNTYLSLAAQLGLVGFFLYTFPFLYWLKTTVQVWPRLPKTGFASRGFVVMLWMAILYHIVVANTADFRHGASSIIAVSLWWVTLALIANQVYPYTLKEKETEQDKTLAASSNVYHL